MSRTSDPQSYSIAAVSKLTGVSCHVLRAWERRYGYPVPDRTAANQRRYGSEQAIALRRLAELSRAGRPIGRLIADLREGRLEGSPGGARHPPGAAPDEATGAMTLVDALLAGDLAAADARLGAMEGRLAPADLIARVIEPALVEVGERWFRGEATIFRERPASGLLLRRLGRLLDDARRANPRPIHRAIVAAPQGERHEGGVLILGVLLELAGWRTMTLGVDVPVAELRAAARAWRPDAIGISFVLSRNINKRFAELATIPGVPIFVGGRSLLNHKALARRHGLTPLSGPVAGLVSQWNEAYGRWSARKARRPAATV